ncbi:MAG: tetratricopeptide repeat protein [Candidatus Hodarchaeota archaeon]
MEDPKRILAEIESLMDNYCYNQAQLRLREALDLKVNSETRCRILLMNIKAAISRGEPIVPELQAELRDLLDSDMNAEVRAEALHVMGKVEERMGRYAAAIGYLQESLSCYNHSLNPKATVSALITLAGVHADQGHWDEQKKALVEAFRLSRESGDSQGFGKTLISWANYERNRGFHDLAIGHYERASQLLEEVGDRINLAVALHNLADLEITRGHLSKGLHLLQQILYHERITGLPRGTAIAVTQMGRVNMLKGNLHEAEGFLRAAIDLTLPDRTRNPGALYYALCNMAEFERKRGNLEQALQLAQDAIASLKRSDFAGMDLAFSWGMVTSILLEMGDITEAEEALETGEVICNLLEFSEGIVNMILLRGILELQKGNYGLAQEYLEKAREESEEINVFEVQIQTELSLADLALRRLKIDYRKELQESAANCLLRASRLAEQATLLTGKLEAKILEAVALSINLRFEDAVKILRDVETTAHSLELHLIEEKARKIGKTVRSRMRALNIPTEADEEMLEYISKAQEFIAEMQIEFGSSFERL